MGVLEPILASKIGLRRYWFCVKMIMRKQILSLFLCLWIGLLATSCARAAKSPLQKTTKPLLLVSIPPYQSLVQQIAGEGFDVLTVVPPSADPHTYEPTARQLTQISEGQLWFRIGEPFEQKLLPLLQKAKTKDLRQGLPMIELPDHHHCGHFHDDSFDRHIWLSPKMISSQITAIAETLSEQFPEHKEAFFARASALQKELCNLDREIELRLHETSKRSFLVSHPAFAYFCRDYNCHQLSIEQEGKEPRAKEIEQVLQAALATGAELAIAIPQHNNKGAQLVARKLKIPVRFIDPYADDCMETMRKLAKLIENPYQTDDAP